LGELFVDRPRLLGYDIAGRLRACIKGARRWCIYPDEGSRSGASPKIISKASERNDLSTITGLLEACGGSDG
jgi:hypothetical protein